jgi:hypothetical protein
MSIPAVSSCSWRSTPGYPFCQALVEHLCREQTAIKDTNLVPIANLVISEPQTNAVVSAGQPSGNPIPRLSDRKMSRKAS